MRAAWARYFISLRRHGAISGYLLNVNPFNQPGVESYKGHMFALLGKPGFEEESRKLTDSLEAEGPGKLISF